MQPNEYFKDRSKIIKSTPHVNYNLNSSREMKLEVPTNRADNDILVLMENNNKNDENNIINKTSENKDKSLIEEIDSLTNLRYNKPTYHDYLRLDTEEAYHDKRNFVQYVFDDIIQNHSIVKLIFKHSILDPNWLSLIKLFFRLNLIFAINAMGFSESVIEKRASTLSRVYKA
jgi:hypothetical protein